MLKEIMIRRGDHSDLKEMQDLFVETVYAICSKDYDSQQIDVWTSSVRNKERWEEMLDTQFVLIAQTQHSIVGFATLNKGNYLDFLYVHKDYQRQGIAKRLYADIEKEARRQGQALLTADVSNTAKPFFESIGFHVTEEQTIVRKGIELMNFKMTRKLTTQ